jgi:hypothetical protein
MSINPLEIVQLYNSITSIIESRCAIDYVCKRLDEVKEPLNLQRNDIAISMETFFMGSPAMRVAILKKIKSEKELKTWQYIVGISNVIPS